MKPRTFWRRTSDKRWMDDDEVYWIVYIFTGFSAAFWNGLGWSYNCIEGVGRHHHFKDLGLLALTMAEIKENLGTTMKCTSRGTDNILFERRSYRINPR